jgi:surfeit locus 1 family protein
MVFFRTSLKLAAPLFILALLFGGLGLWQLERKAEKVTLFQRFENAPELTLEHAMAQQEIFAQVEAAGRYDPERHILLDNKILDGRAGVNVLTPFILPDNSVLLVNRGWLPLPPDRRQLPVVPTDASTRTIKGQLNRLPESGPRLGDADVLLADQWPQLVTYLDLLPVSKALNTPLAPWLVQLDASDPTGFEGRQWKAATMKPDVHGAYAFQWFSLAATAIAIWIVLGVRRGTHLRNSSASAHSNDRNAR